MTGRPRHNIARLPLVVRDRIAELLLDGATYEEIRDQFEDTKSVTIL